MRTDLDNVIRVLGDICVKDGCDEETKRLLGGAVADLSRVARTLDASAQHPSCVDGRHWTAIIDAAADCVMLVAGDGHLLHLNPAGRDLVQALCDAPAANPEWSNLVAPEHRARWQANHERIVAGQFCSWEFDGPGAVGHRRSFEIHGVPVPMSGAAVAHLAVIRDITERRQSLAGRLRAQEALKRLHSELVHISRASAMDTMASALAHELNQPLSAATSYAEAGAVIASQRDDADARLIDTINRAADQSMRAGEILRRLRRRVDQPTVSLEAISVRQTVEEALTIAFADANAVGVGWYVRLDPAAPTVWADRIQIEQVLISLIRNAVEAMQASTDKFISITTRVAAADELEFSIQDSGPGVAPELRDRLFMAFSTTKEDGLGVGLSICRTIVEAHGGRIWLDEGGEAGARFLFTLPLQPVEL